MVCKVSIKILNVTLLVNRREKGWETKPQNHKLFPNENSSDVVEGRGKDGIKDSGTRNVNYILKNIF